jgi:hypothetical protein
MTRRTESKADATKQENLIRFNVIEVIDSIFKFHRTTPTETKALEAPKPR